LKKPQNVVGEKKFWGEGGGPKIPKEEGRKKLTSELGNGRSKSVNGEVGERKRRKKKRETGRLRAICKKRHVGGGGTPFLNRPDCDRKREKKIGQVTTEKKSN